MAKKLNPKILNKLAEKSHRKESSIRPQLSVLRRQNPSITLNAAAQLYAQKNNFSVIKMLDEEDRATLPSFPQTSRPTNNSVALPKNKGNRSRPAAVILDYQTSNSFGKKHVEEINRAYNCGCYTAAFILCRKLFENLIINEILIKKYLEKKKENRELYYNTAQGRFRDFSEIENNVYQRRKTFPPTCIKPIERLHSKLKPFMSDANDYTHSWYHICSKKEFDEINMQEIADLITSISSSI